MSRTGVLVALRVAAPRARSFSAFTAEIGEWWCPNGLFRFTDRAGGRLAFEPDPPQRLVEIGADGERFEIGAVTVWDPPHRLVSAWRQAGIPLRPVHGGLCQLRRRGARHARDRRALRRGRDPPGPRGPPRIPAERVPAAARRVMAGAAAFARRPRQPMTWRRRSSASAISWVCRMTDGNRDVTGHVVAVPERDGPAERRRARAPLPALTARDAASSGCSCRSVGLNPSRGRRLGDWRCRRR